MESSKKIRAQILFLWNLYKNPNEIRKIEFCKKVKKKQDLRKWWFLEGLCVSVTVSMVYVEGLCVSAICSFWLTKKSCLQNFCLIKKFIMLEIVGRNAFKIMTSWIIWYFETIILCSVHSFWFMKYVDLVIFLEKIIFWVCLHSWVELVEGGRGGGGGGVLSFWNLSKKGEDQVFSIKRSGR